MKNISTVIAAYAYDSTDGRTFILQLNQSLDFSNSMEHGLLCPNQVQINGGIVDDVPPLLDYYNTSKHVIWFRDNDIVLSFHTHGPISYLPVRFPTDEDLDFGEYLELTSPDYFLLFLLFLLFRSSF